MRTEEQVIKDFEKIGYKLTQVNEYLIKLQKEWDEILIDFKNKTYLKSYGTFDFDSVSITVEEHKLLHELFKCWGWIE